MQGLNRYIPPDYDPRKNSTLNSHQGKKHALGVRAKDIDKGILVVRFELPFNIWCGTCNAHIGAGVRYNARKQKVGNYYSTPIFAFRCKCHLCDGWFEIRTDPKNAAYVVHEGARKKDEDWDPEENGGFAVHDTEAPSASEPPSDPFAGVEKTIDQQKWAKRGTSRLTELTQSSDRLSSDPYVVSSALRRKFREEKKILLDNQRKDEDLKAKFGLSEDIDLGSAVDDAEGLGNKDSEIWTVIRENRGLPVQPSKGNEESSGTPSKSTTIPPSARRNGSGNGKGKAKATAPEPASAAASPGLVGLLRRNTEKKYDPFSNVTPVKVGQGILATGAGSMKSKGRVKATVLNSLTPKSKEKEIQTPVVGGLLAGYTSD